jgi:hypothetical protein
MKKVIVLLGTALALMGCKPEYEGQLKVTDASLTGVVKGHKVTFPTGSYHTLLTINSKTKATLKVKAANASYDLVLNIPKSVQLPSESGPIRLTAAQSGQPFDIDGDLVSRTYQTEVQTGQMSCERQEPETVCWGGPHPGCATRWVTYPGWQRVQYYDVVNEKRLTADLKEAGTAHVSATLFGSNSESKRHYLYQGPCY